MKSESCTRRSKLLQVARNKQKTGGQESNATTEATTYSTFSYLPLLSRKKTVTQTFRHAHLFPSPSENPPAWSGRKCQAQKLSSTKRHSFALTLRTTITVLREIDVDETQRAGKEIKIKVGEDDRIMFRPIQKKNWKTTAKHFELQSGDILTEKNCTEKRKKTPSFHQKQPVDFPPGAVPPYKRKTRPPVLSQPSGGGGEKANKNSRDISKQCFT